MRNKYGKLFIEIEDLNGGIQVKEEFRQPLLDYCKSEQYKDIVIKYNILYFNVSYQALDSTSVTIVANGLAYGEGTTILYGTTIGIEVNLVTNEITINYFEV